MKTLKSRILWAILILACSQNSLAFTVKISGEGGALESKAESKNCKAAGEEAFTANAGRTVYSSGKAYSGNRSIKMTIEKGKTGFGTFGGTLQFKKCEHSMGRNLEKGDEIWIRTRIYFPENFEFNQGRNKFMRLRTYNTINGNTFSEGYNDLYINGHPEHNNFNPFWFIFEGEQNWYYMGTKENYFDFGEWKTVEMYLKFDNKKESQGGDARVRVWVDGELIGDTGERRTLRTETSFVTNFSLFTWFGNEGSPKTQSLYIDDLFITTNRPDAQDTHGNHFIGMGEPKTAARPNSPGSVNIH